MTRLSISFVLLSLLLVSCDKTTTVVSLSSWTLGSSGYTGTYVQNVNNKQVIATVGQDTMQVFFSVLPTTSQTYTVVSESKAVTNTLGSNELAVRYSLNATDTYLSTGAPAGSTVNVTITSGSLISFLIPATSVEHRISGIPHDTITASGTIEEH